MANKKPYVRIQSNQTINVTAGLHSVDVSNPSAHIPDRLKVNPMWPKLTVLIKQGVGIYPSEITEWATVKALAKDRILTIGEYLDSAEEDVEQSKAKLTNSIKAVELAKENAKPKSLADVAGE